MADSPRRVGAQYHWRWRGSRCCSEWEAVGSLRSNHRETGAPGAGWRPGGKEVAAGAEHATPADVCIR